VHLLVRLFRGQEPIYTRQVFQSETMENTLTKSGLLSSVETGTGVSQIIKIPSGLLTRLELSSQPHPELSPGLCPHCPFPLKHPPSLFLPSRPRR
jgi:hypothetical protein